MRPFHLALGGLILHGVYDGHLHGSAAVPVLLLLTWFAMISVAIVFRGVLGAFIFFVRIRCSGVGTCAYLVMAASIRWLDTSLSSRPPLCCVAAFMLASSLLFTPVWKVGGHLLLHAFF